MSSLPTILGGGAALGVVVGFWGQIKNYALKIYGLFVVRAKVQGHQATAALSSLLRDEFKASKITKKLYRGSTEYVRPHKRNELVAYEMLPSEPTVFWRGWRPLIVKSDPYDGCFYAEVTCLRLVFDIDKLLEEAMSKFNASYTRSNRFSVHHMTGSVGTGDNMAMMMAMSSGGSDDGGFMDGLYEPSKHNSRPVGWGCEDLGVPSSDNPLDALALPVDAEDVVEEAKWWIEHEEWYKTRGVPWKSGFLFYGPTGTGKTVTAKAIAQHLDIPIFMFDLATMNNKDFVEKWGEMLEKSPCMALFEDLDNVFHGRENIVKSGDDAVLSFDCLLNGLDGIDNTDGLMVVVTTNNMEKLDPALGISDGDGISTRPGRVDRAAYFGPLDEEGRRKIARRIFFDVPEDKWQHLIEAGAGDSGARFQARCCREVRKFKKEA